MNLLAYNGCEPGRIFHAHPIRRVSRAGQNSECSDIYRGLSIVNLLFALRICRSLCFAPSTAVVFLTCVSLPPLLPRRLPPSDGRVPHKSVVMSLVYSMKYPYGIHATAVKLPIYADLTFPRQPQGGGDSCVPLGPPNALPHPHTRARPPTRTVSRPQIKTKNCIIKTSQRATASALRRDTAKFFTPNCKCKTFV
jgi:hypothetical protein